MVNTNDLNNSNINPSHNVISAIDPSLTSGSKKDNGTENDMKESLTELNESFSKHSIEDLQRGVDVTIAELNSCMDVENNNSVTSGSAPLGKEIEKTWLEPLSNTENRIGYYNSCSQKRNSRASQRRKKK